MVGVPFERPAELGTRTELTAEEFAARQKQTAQRFEADAEEPVLNGSAAGDGTGPPSHWLEGEKGLEEASLIVEPANGHAADDAERQRRTATVKNTYVVFTGFNDPERTRSLRPVHLARRARIDLPSHPQQRQSDLQFPGLRRHPLRDDPRKRIVPLDGRPHLPPPPPVHGRRTRPLGKQHPGRRDDELNGRTGAQGNGNMLMMGDDLKLVERFTRLGPTPFSTK